MVDIFSELDNSQDENPLMKETIDVISLPFGAIRYLEQPNFRHLSPRTRGRSNRTWKGLFRKTSFFAKNLQLRPFRTYYRSGLLRTQPWGTDKVA